MLALNIRGCAGVAADFLGDKLLPAFHRNELLLRVPAAFFAVLGFVLFLVNLKIIFFGFS
ncbi:hypothetical protein [Streptomyces sp. HB132]|uniref:hypothetical protein n=1 Tax=Streptomyces sp. HB132 TaxID=767388 RepID=UPI001D659505|nr:hypothetical protein [Streptomyces sp. HB132]MBM7442022.1 hypothetical protein [Streptomyces sp. HB132]